MVVVQSLNGRITKGFSSVLSSWTSKEDQDFFFGLIGSAKLIIMGSKTYDTAKKNMIHKPETLRVVMTRRPQTYQDQSIPGQLEFASDTVEELVQRLSDRGYSEGLLIGGAHITKLFLEKNLIQDLLLTLEPYVFGVGRPFAEEGDYLNQMQLLEVKRLNQKGTLLLHYAFTGFFTQTSVDSMPG